jgi:UDP:flavonoid glycosyltransferase YjiC (YdhE family)
MRVLMSSWPTLGHLHPCLGLANAMRQAGHEVRVAAAPGMAPHVRAAGHTHVTMGFDIVGDDVPVTAAFSAQAVKLVQDSMDSFTAELRKRAAEWPADVMIQDWSLPAGAAAAKQLGLPAVALGELVHPPMDQLAASQCFLGLAGLDAPERIFGDLLLSLYPPSLGWPGAPPLAHEHHVRPPFYDGGTTWEPPDWLAERGDAPLILVTMGSVFHRWPGVLESLIAAAGEVAATVVVTVYDRNRASLGPVPGNVRIERYVPMSLLLPHCSAVICQGGANTLFAALSHGVPVGAVTPGRFVEAQRCSQVGAGLLYEVEDDRTTAPDPQRIRRMMTSLLEDGNYRRAARRVRDDFRALPDIHDAVNLVESQVG